MTLSVGDHERVALALIKSRAQAISFAEALDNEGLLNTGARRKETRAEVLNLLRILVQAERPETLLRWHFGDSRPVTPNQVWEAAQAWIMHFVETEEAK
jgi:hypothetical protein